MDEEAVGATDNIVTEFHTYEDFLDSQITPLDLYYLEVCVSGFFVDFLYKILVFLDWNWTNSTMLWKNMEVMIGIEHIIILLISSL